MNQRPLIRHLTTVFWRTAYRVVLLASAFALATGIWYALDERKERLTSVVEALEEHFRNRQKQAEALLAVWGKDPYFQESFAFLERYASEIGELAFFLPIAEELSPLLHAAVRWTLAERVAVQLDLAAGISALVTSEGVFWRHPAAAQKPLVYTGRGVEPYQGRPIAWLEEETPNRWRWIPQQGWSLVRTESHEAWRVRVRVEVAPEQLDSLWSAHGWSLARIIPQAAAAEHPGFRVKTLSSRIIWELGEQQLIFELQDETDHVPVLALAFAEGVLLALLLTVLLNQALLRQIRREIVEPVETLSRVIQGLADREQRFGQVATERWPRELAALHAHLVSAWQALKERTASIERLAQALDQVGDGVVITDATGAVIYLNRAAERLFGYTLIEASGKKPGDLWGITQENAAFYRLLWETLAQNRPFRVTFRNRQASGRILDVEEHIAPMRSEAGELLGYVAVVREVGETQQLLESLQRARFTDPLTGLSNRLGLLWQLQGALAARTPLTLVLLDLDHFSLFNASRGAAAGDQLLVRVGEQLQRWQASCRCVLLLARLEADRFAAVLQGENSEHQPRIVELVKRLREMVLDQGQAGELLSVGVGVAEAFRDAEDAAGLLQAAEYALQAAKGRGAGQVEFFSSKLSAQIRREHELVARMQESLSRGEFALWLQPIVDRSGALIGAEALIRWLPPGASPISPLEFIPLAEKSGLIHSLGLWVFQEAWSIAKRLWQEGWASPQVAINVSAVQLEDGSFSEQLLKAQAAWNATHVCRFPISIEITESSAMERLEQLKAAFVRWIEHGIEIAIDDFGTGHSSLARLRDLPANKLKIDRSFVVRLFDSRRDEALVRSIVHIAHAFNLAVVAEGVEDERFWARLIELGCDAFQGYYFARPMAVEEFIGWMRPRLAAVAQPGCNAVDRKMDPQP